MLTDHPWVKTACCLERLSRISPSGTESHIVQVSIMQRQNQNPKLIKRPNGTLGCTRQSIANRSREVILPFSSAPERSHLECCVHIWAAQYKRDMDRPERLQQSSTNTTDRSIFPTGKGWKNWDSLAWRRLGTILLMSTCAWRESAKRMEPVVPSDRTRGCGHTLKHQRFLLNVIEHILLWQ